MNIEDFKGASEIERFIKATDAAWASASWAAEDVASASAAMNDYMKARDILRSELAAREWVGLTGEDIEKILLSGPPWRMTEYHIYALIEAKLKEKNT